MFYNIYLRSFSFLVNVAFFLSGFTMVAGAISRFDVGGLAGLFSGYSSGVLIGTFEKLTHICMLKSF